MAKHKFAGMGGARTLVDLRVGQLELDSANPRLPEEIQGKSEEEVLDYLYRNFDLDELASSFSENGYFDEEPLVAVPRKMPKEFAAKDPAALKDDEHYKKFLRSGETKLVVVEGNRRLAAIKILISPDLRHRLRIQHWPMLNDAVRQDLMKLPVIVYVNRSEVLPYLGVRHISGIKRWEPFAKARYVADLIQKGLTMEDIERRIGDRNNSAKKSYLCYRLVKQIEGHGVDVDGAKDHFSYLLLAINQLSVRQFLGISSEWRSTRVVNAKGIKFKNLTYLFKWLFGDGEILPLIVESRDITNKLAPILRSREATKQLFSGMDLETAFAYTEGEEAMLVNYLSKANRYIELSLGIVHRHKTRGIKNLVGKLEATIEQLRKYF